jgi:glucose-6-phosphate dehydrogenase assembly protein OpcA
VEEAVTPILTSRQSVEPRQIRQALGSIWRECCDPKTGDLTRALTHNIIAVAAPSDREILRNMLRDLVARQPCRAFVTTLGDESMSAAVQGMATSRARGRHLVLEEIELGVPPAQLDSLVGIVRPLLVTDIPTHLFWSGDLPIDDGTFDALAEIVDHIIVDSTRAACVTQLHDLMFERRIHGDEITDLAWLRVRPWRRALAEGFERGPFDPDRETRVRIRHGVQATNSSALVGRWLERRLAANVELEQAEDSDELTPTSIDLLNGSTRILASSSSQNRIEVSVTTEQACFLPFAVAGSRGRDVDLLAAAIDLS